MFVSEKHGTLALSEQCVLQSLKAGLAAVLKNAEVSGSLPPFRRFFNVMKSIDKGRGDAYVPGKLKLCRKSFCDVEIILTTVILER